MSIRTYIAETWTEFPHDAPDVNARRVGERVLEEVRTKAALWTASSRRSRRRARPSPDS